MMDFSLQLQCCFQLAGDGGADAFGDKNNIIIFRERNVFQLGDVLIASFMIGSSSAGVRPWKVWMSWP